MPDLSWHGLRIEKGSCCKQRKLRDILPSHTPSLGYPQPLASLFPRVEAKFIGAVSHLSLTSPSPAPQGARDFKERSVLGVVPIAWSQANKWPIVNNCTGNQEVLFFSSQNVFLCNSVVTVPMCFPKQKMLYWGKRGKNPFNSSLLFSSVLVLWF